MDVVLKAHDANSLLNALTGSSTQQQCDVAVQKLKAAIHASKRAGSRQRAWFVITRVLPILTVWGLVARIAHGAQLITSYQAALVVAGGVSACLLLPSLASLLLWLPLAALQYLALAHLLATCAFPQACATCNWALSRTLGAVELQHLQQAAALLAAWLPVRVDVSPAWPLATTTPAATPAPSP